MLDYKSIIIKRYALGMSYKELADEFSASKSGTNNRSADYEQPDFSKVYQQMDERKNMTLVYLWGKYQKDCNARGVKPYQYRQFCERYDRWCDENYETLHIQAVIGSTSMRKG